MQQEKRVLWDERVRLVPSGFSWVDHRLVRDGYIRRCDPDALALYLLLVSVSDANGLSYYSDTSICRLVQLTVERLGCARKRLITADLVAYEAPIYQVLSIPEGRQA